MGTSPRDRALAELVRERGAPLTRYAYLFTGDVAAAQDLVQDALVRVFLRTRAGFEPATLEAYVRRVIANLYVDGYRRHRSYVAMHHLIAVHEAHEGHEAAVTEHEVLQQALSGLAPQERAVVVLRFYEDLTVPQVAEAMGRQAVGVELLPERCAAAAAAAPSSTVVQGETRHLSRLVDAQALRRYAMGFDDAQEVTHHV